MQGIELTLIGNRESRWRLEVKDLALLRARMGEDVLRAFVRCFAHCDRLTTLVHLGPLGTKAGIGEVASHRSFITAVWFAIGTLRELAKSLRSLRSALVKKGFLGSDLAQLDRLRVVEDRWENDPFLRGLRNTHAFHVDDDAIAAGLERLYSRTRPVTIVEGDGKFDYECSSRIGSDALFLGLGIDEVEMGRVLQIIHDDFKVYLAVDDLFLGVVKKVGAEFKQRPWTPERRPRLIRSAKAPNKALQPSARSKVTRRG